MPLPVRVFLVLVLFALPLAGSSQANEPGSALAPMQIPLSANIPTPAIPPGGWARTSIPVARCDTPPKIDGGLDDPCWKTASHVAGFYRFTGDSPIPEQTEAWFCADDYHLYFAFHCLDSRPDLIRANETQRNGNIDTDDYVGVDIDAQNSRRDLSSFIVTARGTQQEYLEGGTADNITWAGDWKAATRRTPDGWTCEISIPFALLRYPRGARSFGILLYRKLARETALESWPYLPPGGARYEAQYLDKFTNIAPPFYAPRPVFLPYTLVTAGSTTSVREGMDIKYPLSTTMTGVATLFPDFQTIEQDVTSINFSYTEKQLSDRRPFFAEGSDFLPGSDLFYSRRIATVDEGVKVAGKQGATTLGVLGTTARGPDGQSAFAMNLRQDIGLYSQLGVALVAGNEIGIPANRVARLYGQYGWAVGSQRYSMYGFSTLSEQGSGERGRDDYVRLASSPALPGRLHFTLDYTDVGPNFVSTLGFFPDVNYSGSSFSAIQDNRFDTGALEEYYAEVDLSSYQHETGGFFKKNFSALTNLNYRSGWNFSAGTTISQREQFHDHTTDLGLSWGNKMLFRHGGISDSLGRMAGQPYNFLTVSQGFLLSPFLSVQLDYSRLRLGGTQDDQTIATGTYRLNSYQTLGGRMVREDGDTDVYFSFGQSVPAGADIFVLFGDPNSPRTRGTLAVKIVRPF